MLNENAQRAILINFTNTIALQTIPHAQWQQKEWKAFKDIVSYSAPMIMDVAVEGRIDIPAMREAIKDAQSKGLPDNALTLLDTALNYKKVPLDSVPNYENKEFSDKFTTVCAMLWVDMIVGNIILKGNVPMTSEVWQSVDEILITFQGFGAGTIAGDIVSLDVADLPMMLQLVELIANNDLMSNVLRDRENSTVH